MFDFFKRDLRLITCTIIMMLMLVARDLLSVGVPDIVVTAICVFSMACLKYDQMVSYIFFLFPIMCGVPGYIISAAYIFLVVKGPRLRICQVLPLILVIFLEMINESFRPIEGLYTGMLSFLSFTAVFFYFLDEKVNDKYSVMKSLVYYGIGTSFVFIVIFTNMFQEYGVDSILSGMLRSGALGIADNDVTKMKGHLALNANTIAYMSVSVVAVFSVMLEKVKTHRMFYFVIIAICLVSGILSFSRTFIATVILFYVLLLLKMHGTQKVKLGIILLIVAIASVCLFGNTIMNIIDTFIGRAEEDNFATAGGRTVLFSLYNDAWLSDTKYIIFGVGVVSYIQELHVYNAMHSGLQQIWVCLGVTGFVLYLVRAMTFFKNIYYGQVIFYLPFAITLTIDQSIQFLSPYPLVLVLLSTMVFPQIVHDEAYNSPKRACVY